MTSRTWARFRFSSAGGLGPAGLAADGEVEDHRVTLTGVSDLWATAIHAGGTLAPGQTVTDTLVAGNRGPNAVDAAFPAGTACTWTCAASGSGALDEPVSLARGGSVTFTANGLLAATAAGTLTCTAGVTAPADLADTPGRSRRPTQTRSRRRPS